MTFGMVTIEGGKVWKKELYLDRFDEQRVANEVAIHKLVWESFPELTSRPYDPVYEGEHVLLSQDELQGTVRWDDVETKLDWMHVRLNRALEKVRSIGVEHNDVHGGNVLVDLEEERVFLIDWGSATRMGQTPTSGKSLDERWSASDFREHLSAKPLDERWSASDVREHLSAKPLDERWSASDFCEHLSAKPLRARRTTMDIFNDDELKEILSYIDPDYRNLLRSVCRRWASLLPPRPCGLVAYVRSVPLLRWARQNGSPWGHVVCDRAVQEGELEVLLWAYEHGCQVRSHLSAIAVEQGHLHVLRWLHETGNSYLTTSETEAAVCRGNLPMLKWLRDHQCPWDMWAPVYAAAEGHLEVLQWLKHENCPWHHIVGDEAAANGHLHVLKWLSTLDQPWRSTAVCARAAQGGHLHVLEWARQHGCPWDETVCYRSAQGGHLHVLQWARQHGCPWNERVCQLAAEKGHLHVLQWARQHGCPWDNTVYLAYEHLDVLDWAWNHGCRPPHVHLCDRAASYNRLDVLRWARERGFPWSSQTTSFAALYKNAGVLRWAIDNGCDVDREFLLHITHDPNVRAVL